MRTTCPRRLIAVCVGLLVAFQSAWADEPSEQRPGLLDTPPKEGRYVMSPHGYMVAYKARIPRSDAEFEMAPIPGGTFTIGSPDSEAGRRDDENPRFQITIEPFWMGKHEVTWGEYTQYMKLHDVFREFKHRGIRIVKEDNQADAVSAPSFIYDPSYHFVDGKNPDPHMPACGMTQFAAKQYTKWLGLASGDFYRLPTEAEWEYACRAGSTTAFHFGDDPKQLDDYGWYFANSDEQPHHVGKKKPNDWDLHDMHGNVAEWVLDQHHANYGNLRWEYRQNRFAIAWPSTEVPRVVRGGSWDHDATKCRSAARWQSDEEWKDEDPDLPQSTHWLASSELSFNPGFRIIRPLNAPPPKDRLKFWDADVPAIRDAVNDRENHSGRGATGLVDDKLPLAIQRLKKEDQ